MRVIAFLFVFLLLSACGFRPVYKEDLQFSVAKEMHKIKIFSIAGELGNVFRNALIDEISEGHDVKEPSYILKTTFSISTSPSIIQDNSSVSRFNSEISADFNLTRISDHQIIYKDHVYIFSSFNVPISEYAAMVAEEEHKKLNLMKIAYSISQKIAIFFNRIS